MKYEGPDLAAERIRRLRNRAVSTREATRFPSDAPEHARHMTWHPHGRMNNDPMAQPKRRPRASRISVSARTPKLGAPVRDPPRVDCRNCHAKPSAGTTPDVRSPPIRDEIDRSTPVRFPIRSRTRVTAGVQKPSLHHREARHPAARPWEGGREALFRGTPTHFTNTPRLNHTRRLINVAAQLGEFAQE